MCFCFCVQGSRVQTKVGLLMLLCTWISNCPIAVMHFLHNQDNVPFVSFYPYTHTWFILLMYTNSVWLISLYNHDKVWILVNNSQWDYRFEGDQVWSQLVVELHLQQPHYSFQSLQTRVQPVCTLLAHAILLSTVTCLSEALFIMLP